MGEYRMTRTPGPWTYIFGSVYAGTREQIEETSHRHPRLLMADRDEPQTTPVERDRNTQLAAHAPEMLDELVGLIDNMADALGDERLDRISSLIDRATAA